MNLFRLSALGSLIAVMSLSVSGCDNPLDNINPNNGGGQLFAAAPKLFPEPGTYTEDIGVVLTSSTARSDIFFTLDGTDPTSDSTEYTHTIPILGDIDNDPITVTVRAYAEAPTYQHSRIVEGVYTIDLDDALFPTPSPPVITPATGELNDESEITIINTPSVALHTIYYTLDGTDPTTSSPRYTDPLNPTRTDTTLTVRAMSVNQEGRVSPITESVLTYNVAPVIASEPEGVVDSAIQVSLSSATPTAEIYYTTDGTDPECTLPTGTLYTGTAIDINRAGIYVNIKAIACRSLFTPTPLLDVTYGRSGTGRLASSGDFEGDELDTFLVDDGTSETFWIGYQSIANAAQLSAYNNDSDQFDGLVGRGFSDLGTFEFNDAGEPIVAYLNTNDDNIRVERYSGDPAIWNTVGIEFAEASNNPSTYLTLAVSGSELAVATVNDVCDLGLSRTTALNNTGTAWNGMGVNCDLVNTIDPISPQMEYLEIGGTPTAVLVQLEDLEDPTPDGIFDLKAYSWPGAGMNWVDLDQAGLTAITSSLDIDTQYPLSTVVAGGTLYVAVIASATSDITVLTYRDGDGWGELGGGAVVAGKHPEISVVGTRPTLALANNGSDQVDIWDYDGAMWALVTGDAANGEPVDDVSIQVDSLGDTYIAISQLGSTVLRVYRSIPMP